MGNEQKKVSPIAIQKYLKGMDYPAGKEELLRHAKEHRAPEDIQALLSRLPNEQFQTVADVAKGISGVQ